MSARAAVGAPAFLARTGLRAGGLDVVLTVLLVAVTAFLATLAPLWFGQATDADLRDRLTTATEAQRGLEFELRGRLDPSPGDPLAAATAAGADLTAELPAAVRAVVGDPDMLVDSAELLAVGAPRPILRVGLRIQDVDGAIRWTDGRAPTGRVGTVDLPDRPARDGGPSRARAYEVGLSREAADEVGLELGDRVLTVPGTNQAGFVALDVVGIFEPVDPADGRWFADPTLSTVVEERVSPEVTIYHATALLDAAAYPSLHGGDGERGAIPVPFRYRWRYRLEPDAVAGDRVDALAADLARLRAAHPFGGAETPGLSTGLADLVARYRVDRAAATTAVVLAMVGPVVAMLGALALAAAVTAGRRRDAVLLVRSRGGGVLQVAAGRAAEVLLVALPAALVGGLAAALVVEGAWTDGALAPSLAVGLASTALASLAVVVAARRRPTARGGSGGGAGSGSNGRRRLVLDALVIAVAVGGVLSLRGRGVADGSLNPFVAAVPVLVALAGGLVVLRVYPAAAHLASRAAAARTDLVPVHGLRGVARGAAGQLVPLLALLLAVAVAVFSALVVGSVDRAEARAAAEAVGADYRVEGRAGERLPAGLEVAGVPGVGATASAVRTGATLIGTGKIPAQVRLTAVDVPGWLAVADGLALDPGLPPALSAVPLVDAGSEASPLPAIVDGATLARLGLAPGGVGQLTVGPRTAWIRVEAARDRVPGLGDIDAGVVVDLAAARVALPDLPAEPSLVFVRAPGSAAPGLRAAVDRYGALVALSSREAVLAGTRGQPLVGAVRTGFGLATAVAIVYALAVVALAARQAAVARRRELAVLQAIGASPRSLLGLLALELVPLVATALIAGLGLGLLIAALVVPELDVGRLVGLEGTASLAGEPGVLLAVAAAPVLGAVAALAIGASAARRVDLAAATRAVEP